MTDRIAELRALLEAERAADAQRGAGKREAFDAWMRAHAASKRAVHANADALLDCAEALRWLLQDTQHAGHDCGDEQCPVAAARAALAALNGDSHAG